MDIVAIEALFLFPLILAATLAGLYTFMVNLLARMIMNLGERDTLPCYSNAPLYLALLLCAVAYCPGCLSKAVQENPESAYMMYQINQSVASSPVVFEAQQSIAALAVQPHHHHHRRHLN